MKTVCVTTSSVNQGELIGDGHRSAWYVKTQYEEAMHSTDVKWMPRLYNFKLKIMIIQYKIVRDETRQSFVGRWSVVAGRRGGRGGEMGSLGYRIQRRTSERAAWTKWKTERKVNVKLQRKYSLGLGKKLLFLPRSLYPELLSRDTSLLTGSKDMANDKRTVQRKL